MHTEILTFTSMSRSQSRGSQNSLASSPHVAWKHGTNVRIQLQYAIVFHKVLRMSFIDFQEARITPQMSVVFHLSAAISICLSTERGLNTNISKTYWISKMTLPIACFNRKSFLLYVQWFLQSVLYERGGFATMHYIGIKYHLAFKS